MNWREISILGGIAILVVLTVSTIYLSVQGWLSFPIASLVITAIGAFGTIILAGATYLTIRQNQITIEELRKDREKPVVVDTLRQVIHPNLERVNNAARRMRSGQFPYDPGTGVRNQVRLASVGDVDPTTWKRFKDEYPELHDEFTEWMRLFERFDESVMKADEVVSEMLDGEITTEDPSFDHVKNTLIACVESKDLPDDRHQELREMLWGECESVMVDVRRRQYDLFRHLERIEDDLIELEDELKQDYGISSREIESD